MHALLHPERPILCIALTPARQRTLEFARLRPDAVNRALRVHEKASGKGNNVASILHRLGTPVHLVGISAGATGSYVERETAAEGIPAEWVRIPGETRICQTLIDHDTGEVTELVEEAPPIPDSGRRELMDRIDARLNNPAAIALSGKPPPGPAENIYAEIAARASEAGLPVFIDSQGPGLLNALAHHPYLAKLNQHELFATLGEPENESPEALRQAAASLIERGAQSVIVTLGAAGACLFSRSEAWRIGSPRIEPLNPIGSGDAAMAGMLHGLAQGWELPESVRFGAACGAAAALTLASGDLDPKKAEALLPQATATLLAP